MPDLRTVPNVELIRRGTYELDSGTHEFTQAELASAVANAATGKGPAPRVKIGFAELHGAVRANAPALGNVANMRLVEDGDAIRGDLVGVPGWLADILPSAYPTRSVEAVVRPGDDMRITALELLGVTAPGVKDIEDLRALYEEAPPDLVLASGADAAGDTVTVAVAKGSVEDATQVRAATNVDDLRQAFSGMQNTSDSTMVDTPNDYWYVQEIQINPDQLIVEHHHAGVEKLYRVDWTANTDGTFVFGDPVEVEMQYVDVVAAASRPETVYRAPRRDPESGASAEATVRSTPMPMVIPQSTPSVPTGAAASFKQFMKKVNPLRASTPESTLAAERPNSERTPMDPDVLKVLAARYGLDPDKATEAEVNAAIIANKATDAPTPPEAEAVASTTNPNAPDKPVEPDAAGENADKTATTDATTQKAPTAKADSTPIVTPPVTPPVADGAATSTTVAPATVSVSQEVWDETQERLRELVADRTERIAAAGVRRRDDKADEWVRTGRITSDERKLARANLDINEDETTKTYDALAPGKVPVVDAVAISASAAEPDASEEDALYALSCARMGYTPTLVKE